MTLNSIWLWGPSFGALGSVGDFYIAITLRSTLPRGGSTCYSPIHIYPTPLFRQDDTRPVSKRSLTGLNSEFSFAYTSCLTKAEEPSLPYYLPIARGRIIGFIPFPRVLVLCERQWIWSRIWTRVAVSISYDDNHYTIIVPSIGLIDLFKYHSYSKKYLMSYNCTFLH